MTGLDMEWINNEMAESLLEPDSDFHLYHANTVVAIKIVTHMHTKYIYPESCQIAEGVYCIYEYICSTEFNQVQNIDSSQMCNAAIYKASTKELV